MTYQFGDLVLDKYKVEIILGQGAYGDLYRVSHIGFVGQRAIKVFNRNDFFKRSISYENVQRRFKLESLLAKKFNSPKPNPYLLQIYDFLESKEELILEMEYAPAGNLNFRMSEYKSKGIPFQRDRAIRIAYEIAVGMSALHSHDIVHRNIKPANVLFNLRDHALLADLGFAQLPEEPGTRIRPGFTSSYPLSPGYSSPEQLLSSDILTPSSDVYTLGLILFEMLTGKVFSSIGPRTRLSDLIPGVRPSLDELLTNMLSDSPGNRPKDGKSVALELSKELEAEDQAQQEELAKKRRESEEWEKLKNAELAKQKAQEKLQKVTQVIDSSEPVNQTRLQQPEKDHQVRNLGPTLSLNNSQLPPQESISANPVAKTKAEPLVGFTLSPERNGSETKRASNIKKLLGLGAVLVLGLTVFLFLNKPGSDLNLDLDMNTPIPLVSVKPTLDEGPDSTQSITEEVIVLTEPGSQTQTTRPTLTLPLALPPTKSVPDSSITSQSVLLNPSFEDTEGWVLKIGDDHILGKYSGNWASTGSQSYQISLFGNRVYEYCFTPGMRTSVNQTVDLSGVKEIFFDINIRPPLILEGFHGDVINNQVFVFVDKEQVFASSDDALGEYLDQKIALNGKFPGKHDLKFGLMVKSKFCVKGVTEDESLLLYIDNIRLVN